MKHYSPVVDGIIHDEELLKKLLPGSVSNTPALLKIREAGDEEVSGGNAIADRPAFDLLRAALLYACDAIDESHVVVQGIAGDEAAYWHGMIHRREGDFENARYWFRRAGVLPVFDEIHHAASHVSPVVAAQANWDPYLFTGLCEQNRFGDTESTEELVKLQRAEFEVFFDYLWRRCFRATEV